MSQAFTPQGNVYWLRKCSLVAGPKAGGEGIDLSQLRIVFKVSAQIASTPNSLKARIYNPAPATINKLFSLSAASPTEPAIGKLLGGSNQVILDAGYINGPYGNIFTGTLVQVRAGRESQTDTYVDLFAQDGDLAHSAVMMNKTLADGHFPGDQLDAVAESTKPVGVLAEKLPQSVPQTAAPRGKVLFGNARDYLNDLSRTYELTWNIDKGRIITLAYTDCRTGGNQAIELNATSGLIGVPELTDAGISIMALLNPIYGWGTRIHINNKILTKGNPTGPTLNIAADQPLQYTGMSILPDTNADGFYKVLTCDFYGDTRGNDWYARMICMGIDATLTASQALMGVPPPP